MPHALVRVRLFAPETGGRESAVTLSQFGCPVFFGQERDRANDCKFFLGVVGVQLEPGGASEVVPVQFLFPELVTPHLKPGVKLTLWEGKDIGECEVLRVRSGEGPLWSDTADAILMFGVWLEDLGVRNWALNRSQALHALDLLSVADIGVLGGDVYEVSEGRLRSTLESWTCDHMPGETRLGFVPRSIDKARKFVQTLRLRSGDECAFALVPETRS